MIRTSLCSRDRSNRGGTGRAAAPAAGAGSYRSSSSRKPACIPLRTSACTHGRRSACTRERKSVCRTFRSSHDETVPGIFPGTRGRNHPRSRRNTNSWRPAGWPGPLAGPADRRLRARLSSPTRTQHSQEIPPFGNSTSAQGRGRIGRRLPPLECPPVRAFRMGRSLFVSSSLGLLPCRPHLLKPVPLCRQPPPCSFSRFAKRP